MVPLSADTHMNTNITFSIQDSNFKSGLNEEKRCRNISNGLGFAIMSSRVQNWSHYIINIPSISTVKKNEIFLKISSNKTNENQPSINFQGHCKKKI